MTQLEPSSIDPAPRFAPHSNWGSWLSWLVILLVTLALVALSMIEPPEADIQGHPPQINSFELSQLELQGKTLVFQQNLTNSSKAHAENDQKNQNSDKPSVVPKQLDEGTINQRWSYSILLNELESPAKALEHLDLTSKRLTSAQLQLDEQQAQVNQLLEQSFQDCAADEFRQSNLEPEDIKLLQEQLGWFAELLFSADKTQPELKSEIKEQASAVFAWSLALVVIGGLALGLGTLLIVLMAVLSFFGKLNWHFTHQPTRYQLYLQTFALWMLIFIGGQIVFELALGSQAATASRLAWGLIPFLGSLVALGWPLLRGVTLQDLRADIGWKLKNPFVEVISGIASYLMLLPFILFALLVFVGITALTNQQSPGEFSSGNQPSHPIQEWVAEGDSMTIPLIIIMACVAAPIVEETMFRGVFYRYLRDATGHWAWWLSIAAACLVNSLIFAAIHPQGLLALPLLGTLAIGFSLSREHRDSLIAPMVMHGMNNGIVTMMLIFLL